MKPIFAVPALAAMLITWSTPSKAEELPALSPQWMAMLARDMPRAKDQQANSVAAELKAFRKNFLNAAATKDEASLQKFYAPNFTVTHGSGFVETRQSRIANVIRTGGGSEVRQPIAESIRSFGSNVAVMTQVIPFAFESGPSGFLRVATVLNRVNVPDYSGWQIVAMILNTLDKPTPAERIPSGCDAIPFGNVPAASLTAEPKC